jgi:hypothetical protein
VIEVSGMTRSGLPAIRQSKTTDGIAAGGAVAVVFPGVCLTANMVLAGCFTADNVPTVTVPTGYTIRANNGFVTPAAGLQTDTRDSGETTTTVTWGGTSTGAACAAAIELDTSAAPHAPAPRIVKQQALVRASVF